MKTINAWSQVPRFESEEDEAAFWMETRIDSRLMNQALLRADNRNQILAHNSSANGNVGAGISFLWFNTYPASVFMGDIGSLALGGALGTLAMLSKNELVSVLINGVFLFEAAIAPPATKKPREWPLRHTLCRWTAPPRKIAAGKYELRCRTIDANGVAQPGDSDEIQQISLFVPPAPGSTYTLLFGGQETGVINYVGGNVPDAASMLGIGRATLYYKVKQYGLVPAEMEARPT
jgi:hypothetical protein